MSALAQHLTRLDDERAQFGTGHLDHRLLFCWADGRPIYPDTISEHFNRLVDRAGLPAITLHDVRHTYATMSLRAGVNPKIVSARLGHSTVAFTLDLYTEDVPELHHAAAETVTSLFLDASDGPDDLPRAPLATDLATPRAAPGNPGRAASCGLTAFLLVRKIQMVVGDTGFEPVTSPV